MSNCPSFLVREVLLVGLARAFCVGSRGAVGVCCVVINGGVIVRVGYEVVGRGGGRPVGCQIGRVVGPRAGPALVTLAPLLPKIVACFSILGDSRLCHGAL